ncbi:hypothetical protein F2981_02935 [Sinorhizobium meliloti]|nr:hypothetical protein [Sinorhizobium meliloti]
MILRAPGMSSNALWAEYQSKFFFRTCESEGCCGYLAYTVTSFWIIHALGRHPAHAQQAEAHVKQCQGDRGSHAAATFASFFGPRRHSRCLCDTSEWHHLSRSIRLPDRNAGGFDRHRLQRLFRTPSPANV